MEMNIDFGKLTETTRAIMEIAGRPIPESKPITGSRTFTRESGMGLNLIRQEPLALFALNPAFVGQEAGYVMGKKSGVLSVELKLADLNMEPLTEEDTQEVVRRVKALGIEKKALVTDDEFVRIVQDVLG
jgi:methanogen homocitrate synthase